MARGKKMSKEKSRSKSIRDRLNDAKRCVRTDNGGGARGQALRKALEELKCFNDMPTLHQDAIINICLAFVGKQFNGVRERQSGAMEDTIERCDEATDLCLEALNNGRFKKCVTQVLELMQGTGSAALV